MDRNLGLPIQGSLPPVWLALHKWLPRRNPDFDYWWDLSGLHLALMLDAAGYTVAKQYDSLLFHYHWIVSIVSLLNNATYPSKLTVCQRYLTLVQNWTLMGLSTLNHPYSVSVGYP